MSTSTALGATLLGVSATLFAADVAGTLVLERGRTTAAERTASNVVAPIVAPAVLPTADVVRAATLRQVHVQAARPHPIVAPLVPANRVAHAAARTPATALVKARGQATHQRPPAMPAEHGLVAHDGRRVFLAKQHTLPTGSVAVVATVARRGDRHPFIPIVVSIDRGRTAHSYVQPAALPPARRPEAHVQHTAAVPPAHVVANAVTLREVRRFVMFDLKRRDRHVCVISAMTYAAANRQVIVDLVYRDDKGRWAEKAVVRRGGSAVKLIGVKQRALPYRTVALTGLTPGR